jgi:DNA-binding NarL/FixJ family response regulator
VIGVSEEEAVDWLEIGVSGYISPEAPLEELAVAVGRVARGETVASPEVQADLLRGFRRLMAEVPAAAEEEGGLTPHERPKCWPRCRGLSNMQIALRLSIQEQTVKNHVHNILVKLGVRRRAEAAPRARRHGRSSPQVLSARALRARS